MSNFKGTKGKIRAIEIHLETNGWVTIESEIDEDGDQLRCTIYGSHCKNLGEISLKTKADALLISKAPEMLEMLESSINVIKWYMENSIPDENHEDFFNIGMNQREELEILIKEATKI